ncbi:MAG: hypothetical protein SV062_10465, partial [Thermodesulfobacteriota bacterium]|nr:hypothetical protein [Thermodesulfobacteriota bacterium]
EERQKQILLSLWHTPFNNFSISLMYSFMNTDINSSLFYKSFHKIEVEDIFIYKDVPYDDWIHSIVFNTDFFLTPRLKLEGNIYFNRSRVSLDPEWLSNLKIRNISTSIGFNYRIKDRFTLYGKYRLQDYNDQEDDYFDGRVHTGIIGILFNF